MQDHKANATIMKQNIKNNNFIFTIRKNKKNAIISIFNRI